jgi:ABC-2 type transport system permease protein
MTLVSTLVFSGIVAAVWRAVYEHQTDQPLPWATLYTYVLVGQAINFARWSPADRTLIYPTSARVRNGDIALDLLRPHDYLLLCFAEALAFFVVETLWVNLPVLLFYVLVFGVQPPASVGAGVFFAASYVLAFAVAFSLNSVLILLTFWTTNMLGVQAAKQAAVELLSGTLIPFVFFPGWLQFLATHLPFQAMAAIPLSIYTGQLSGAAAGVALLEQVAWVAGMLLVNRLLWRRAFARLTVYGG